MKTERKKGHACFFMSTGGGDFKYYKILDEQDMLEEVTDERTGSVRVKEITSEEYYRMRKEEYQRERRGE